MSASREGQCDLAGRSRDAVGERACSYPHHGQPSGAQGPRAATVSAILSAIKQINGHAPSALPRATPLVRFAHLLAPSPTNLSAKLESFNPSGSAKDRTAGALLRSGFESGDLRDGDHVVESSSGNLGVALAQQCLTLGLSFTCVVDPRTNRSTRALINAYGGHIFEVDQPDPVSGDFLQARIAAVQRILREMAATGVHAWWPNQYANEANICAHAEGTMREIAESPSGPPDVLVVATSTTGTLQGCMRYAKEHGLSTRFVAVDAVGSVLFDGVRGRRTLPGFGAGVAPALAASAVPDQVVKVSDLDSVVGCRRLVRREGYLAGASGGAVVAAVEHLDVHPDETICMVLHDGGERYLDTVYNDSWVQAELGCGAAELAARVQAAPSTWGSFH